jgi:hypothetical protein
MLTISVTHRCGFSEWSTSMFAFMGTSKFTLDQGVSLKLLPGTQTVLASRHVLL